MYCTRNITEELIWVGGNDRRLSLFEGIYSVPDGVAYNSYLLLDKKTVLFDTVDQAVGRQFFENLASALKGRALDYLVVHHMEPDHSAVMEELIEKYPGVRIVCNQKSVQMIRQYFTFDVDSRAVVVKEGDVLETGNHRFTFMMAPMVHWPEVMVTYEPEEGLLFPQMLLDALVRLTVRCLQTKWILRVIIWMRHAAIIPILWENTARRCRRF